MSATAIHKFITFVGFMSILHAAYSAAQREYPLCSFNLLLF